MTQLRNIQRGVSPVHGDAGEIVTSELVELLVPMRLDGIHAFDERWSRWREWRKAWNRRVSAVASWIARPYWAANGAPRPWRFKVKLVIEWLLSFRLGRTECCTETTLRVRRGVQCDALVSCPTFILGELPLRECGIIVGPRDVLEFEVKFHARGTWYGSVFGVTQKP